MNYKFDIEVLDLRVFGRAEIVYEDNYPRPGSFPYCYGVSIDGVVEGDEPDPRIERRLPRPVHIGEVLEQVMRQVELKRWFQREPQSLRLSEAIVADFESNCEAKADEAADRRMVERRNGN